MFMASLIQIHLFNASIVSYSNLLFFFSISCLIVCPEMATDATLDFFILLFIIALLIALENKYPISLLSLPRSVKEILFNSIKVLIFSFNRVGIFDE